MSSFLNVRVILFSIAFIFGVIFSAPSLLSLAGPKITLGLDLQGGMYMLLEVKSDEAVKSKYKSLASSVNYFAKEEKIIVDRLRYFDDYVEFEILDRDEVSIVDEFLSGIVGLEIVKSDLKYRLTFTQEEIISIKDYALEQAIGTIRNRLDEFGLAEPSVTKQGDQNILVELPGIKSQEEEQRARELIARSAHLQLMAVDEDRNPRVSSMSEEEAQSYGSTILHYSKEPDRTILLQAIPILDGSMLTDARVAFDQANQAVINFTLNSQGAKIFGDFSGENVGNRMAIVLDNKVYSAPVIRERIGGGSGQISGGFTVEEASDIAIALRSGALAAPVVMLEKRSVGPSLGADSIKSSLIALISGFILVVLFMVLYYGLSGVVANIAIFVNLLLIISVMSLFGATLTLPGMAGIILVVGIAVDANIIINERIKECLRDGESIRKSIALGYSNASRAILDANITTLIASVILYGYGSGPIKGFAITMIIGILASMLTAIVGTHGMYETMLKKIEKSKNLKLWFGLKVEKV